MSRTKSWRPEGSEKNRDGSTITGYKVFLSTVAPEDSEPEEAPEANPTGEDLEPEPNNDTEEQ